MSIVNSEAGDHLLAEASKSNNMFPYVEHQISRITRGTEKLAQGESLMPEHPPTEDAIRERTGARNVNGHLRHRKGQGFSKMVV